jgi:hypothetical protein
MNESGTAYNLCPNPLNTSSVLRSPYGVRRSQARHPSLLSRGWLAHRLTAEISAAVTLLVGTLAK